MKMLPWTIVRILCSSYLLVSSAMAQEPAPPAPASPSACSGTAKIEVEVPKGKMVLFTMDCTPPEDSLPYELERTYRDLDRLGDTYTQLMQCGESVLEQLDKRVSNCRTWSTLGTILGGVFSATTAVLAVKYPEYKEALLPTAGATGGGAIAAQFMNCADDATTVKSQHASSLTTVLSTVTLWNQRVLELRKEAVERPHLTRDEGVQRLQKWHEKYEQLITKANELEVSLVQLFPIVGVKHSEWCEELRQAYQRKDVQKSKPQ